MRRTSVTAVRSRYFLWVESRRRVVFLWWWRSRFRFVRCCCRGWWIRWCWVCCLWVRSILLIGIIVQGRSIFRVTFRIRIRWDFDIFIGRTEPVLIWWFCSSFPGRVRWLSWVLVVILPVLRTSWGESRFESSFPVHPGRYRWVFLVWAWWRRYRLCKAGHCCSWVRPWSSFCVRGGCGCCILALRGGVRAGLGRFEDGGLRITWKAPCLRWR